jgi:N-acetylglucosaminyl-diphospho-decaprenol L-rhamnosyltransferase
VLQSRRSREPGRHTDPRASTENNRITTKKAMSDRPPVPHPADRLLDVIIVVSAGGRELLIACLDSLERYPLRSAPMAVHVVDNASRDGTAEEVRTRFQWVDYEELEWNSGFCIANNIALRRSSAPFALLLNPDTEVTEGALDYALNALRSRPEVGMLSCRLVQPDGTFDHAAKRSFPTPLGALGHFTGVGRRGGASRRLAQYRAPELGEHEAGEVDAVNGAFMLVRREAVVEVGLLDEGYWLYMDDLDWCYRFKQKGWKVFYDGGATVIHVKGGTTKVKRHRGLRHNLAFHRAMGRFYRKFYAGEHPVFDGLIYAAIGGKLLISVARSSVARRRLR